MERSRDGLFCTDSSDGFIVCNHSLNDVFLMTHAINISNMMSLDRIRERLDVEHLPSQ